MACPIPRTSAELAHWAEEVRARVLGLVDDLCDDDLDCEKLAVTNPFVWELGHIAWFHERFLLRADGSPSMRRDADELFDSMEILHDTRWDLPLPRRSDALVYLETIAAKLRERLERGDPKGEELERWRLCLFHEEMHAEAFTYMRQTLGHPSPIGAAHAPAPELPGPPPEGDAEVPAGRYRIGSDRDEDFTFDNERWAHEVELDAFHIARAPVTNAEYADFVDDGGYVDDRWWTDEGRGWERRAFDRWVSLEASIPVAHLSWHEASAFCAWAGRRLPTEAEWEVAARWDPSGARRRFPWGEAPPDPTRAVLGGATDGPVDVGACPAGASALGLVHLVGNVWEWTASSFEPFPGFAPAAYREYSEPWFGTRRVLRGGSWATGARMARNAYRNFFEPWRRDVPAGLRTCAR